MPGLLFMLKGRLCVGKKDGNTVAQIAKLAQPIAEELGLTLWDVRFEKEGADWFLRIIIDSQDGITCDDCEAVSRPLSKLLDELDPIEQSYYLEVSSPGTERELRRPEHFEACMGERVTVKLIRPRDGKREFLGVLKQSVDRAFTIEENGEELSFPLSECAYIKLYDDFEIGTI